jgi:hypothetical protein
MTMSYQTKLVLCATASQLLAGVWRSGQLIGSQVFANNGSGYEDLTRLLQQYPTAALYLIADAVEEDYRLEHLPHTSGAARRELIERKLNQYYRGLDYRSVQFLQRDQALRKDDQFLFIALNNADFLHGWVTAIHAAGAQLVGVYLLPMLSQIVLQQLKLTAPYILLCEKLSSGLRQTYCHHGRTYMSRLVPNMPSTADQLTDFYAQETEKTRRYLISQRYISADTPLQLVLLSADDAALSTVEHLGHQSGFSCRHAQLSPLLKAMDLSAPLIERMPELVHMQLLASGHVVANLAPVRLTKPYLFSRVARTLKIATLATAFTGLCVAAWFFTQGWQHKTALALAQQATQFEQQRYAAVAKNFPLTTISIEELQAVLALDKTIAAYPKSPQRLMHVVSSALDASAEIKLDRLRWLLSPDINVRDEDPLITVAFSANPAAATTSAAEAATLLELGFVTAQILTFSGDYRSALNSVNRFVQHLRANHNVASVEILQQPINSSSYVNLQGSTDDQQTSAAQAMQTQPALFKLKVLLKAEVPGATSANGEHARP